MVWPLDLLDLFERVKEWWKTPKGHSGEPDEKGKTPREKILETLGNIEPLPIV